MTKARTVVREYFHVDDEETTQATVELLDKDKFMCGDGLDGKVRMNLVMVRGCHSSL
jgi:hypothetical protein